MQLFHSRFFIHGCGDPSAACYCTLISHVQGPSTFSSLKNFAWHIPPMFHWCSYAWLSLIKTRPPYSKMWDATLHLDNQISVWDATTLPTLLSNNTSTKLPLQKSPDFLAAFALPLRKESVRQLLLECTSMLVLSTRMIATMEQLTSLSIWLLREPKPAANLKSSLK